MPSILANPNPPPDHAPRWLAAARVLSLALCAAGAGARAAEDADAVGVPAVAWEGAIGLVTHYRPEYAGADRRVLRATPVVFLRYGRFTVTNASGFVTRRSDDVVRGLGVDVLQGERLSVKLSLRIDRGREEDTSRELAGLGDIPPTIRARLMANWRLPGPWRAGASWSVDALGRGGGNLGDVSLGWEQRLGSSAQLGVGLSLALAGDRYMQTYYGVSEAQAASTGLPVYKPGAGLRDVTTSINLRQHLGPEWTALASLAASRQLGPAAASPLTRQRNGWSASLAAARRF